MSSSLDLNSLIPDPLSFHYKVDPWEKDRCMGQNDGYFTESEEEVLYDLDEVAIATLPLHLQDNMREIHLERVRRLQKENNNTIFFKPPYHASLRASWYRDSMARMAASQDMAKRNHGVLPDSSSEQARWYLHRSSHIIHEEMLTMYDTIAMANPYSHRSSSFFSSGNDPFFSKGSTSMEGGTEAEFASDRNASSRYLLEPMGAEAHAGVVHTFEGNGASHGDGPRAEGRSRERSSSIVSAMRGRVRKSIHKMSKVFRK